MLPATVYLSLGSNLGNRQQNLRRAIDALAPEKIRVVAISDLYETEPQDVTDQPWFLNMAIECCTELSAFEFLTSLHRIERALGRVREGTPPGGPRLIDLDILLFGDLRLATPQLTLPHPRMLQRRFVLEPLLELAPDLKDPVTGQPLRTSLQNVKGQSIKRIGPLELCPP